MTGDLRFISQGTIAARPTVIKILKGSAEK